MQRQLQKKRYPKMMSADTADNFDWRYAGDNEKYAKRIVREKGGMLYSQVDKESKRKEDEYRFYFKGTGKQASKDYWTTGWFIVVK